MKKRQNKFSCVLLLLIVGVAHVAFGATNIEIPANAERGVPGELTTPDAKILALIGSEERPRLCLYADVVQSLDKESVPLLRNMLSDEAYRNRWFQISKMLAWLSDKSDEESVSAILSYVQRPDTWADSETMNSAHIMGKAVALGLLGLFQTDSARDSLRRTMTPEGARKLIAPWVDLRIAMRKNSPEDNIVRIRGHAAKGLVLSREAENISLVRKVAEDHIHLFLTQEYLESEKQDVDYDQETYGFLASALAGNDLIEEIGLEEYLRVSDGPDSIGVLWKHLDRYIGTDLGDGRYIVDPCPMCGKTRD
jgi:hypothetical protein